MSFSFENSPQNLTTAEEVIWWMPNTAWKVSVFRVLLVRIFPRSDWIRTRKLRIRTLFTQWKLLKENCLCSVFSLHLLNNIIFICSVSSWILSKIHSKLIFHSLHNWWLAILILMLHIRNIAIIKHPILTKMKRKIKLILSIKSLYVTRSIFSCLFLNAWYFSINDLQPTFVKHFFFSENSQTCMKTQMNTNVIQYILVNTALFSEFSTREQKHFQRLQREYNFL